MTFSPALAHPLIDSILEIYRTQIGAQWDGYRNHCLTVYNIVRHSVPLSSHDDEVVVIASAFHDIALWSDDRIDYLDPSIAHAREWCAANGFTADASLIGDMFLYHHKIFPGSLRGFPPLVRAFRDADWSAFTFGWIPYNRGQPWRQAIAAALPDEKFHDFLAARTLRHLREGGIANPLPMMKW